MKKWSFDDFNDEFNRIYAIMVENKYSEADIRRLFAPIIPKSSVNTKLIKLIVLVTALIGFGWYLSTIEAVSWHCSALARIFLIKLLPYWDWTVLKNEKCLIYKPGAKMAPEPTIFECELCENLKTIDVIANSNDQETLKQKYLEIDVPVIIRTNFNKWPNSSQFLAYISSNERIIASIPCALATNIMKSRSQKIRKILESARQFDRFFLHFQNCNFDAMKQFRPIIPKPTFIPIELSPVQYNWLVWNRNYERMTYKMVDLVDQIAIFGQIQGESDIRLTPRNNCALKCDPIEFSLRKGEFLVVTHLWNLEYKSGLGNDNMAAILELH